MYRILLEGNNPYVDYEVCHIVTLNKHFDFFFNNVQIITYLQQCDKLLVAK